MGNKWLDALQKAAPTPPLVSEPPSDTLAKIFGTNDDVVIDPEKTAQVFDDGSADVPDPIRPFLEKSEKDKFRIPEITAIPVHADGTVIEKSVGGTFHYTYKNGRLARTEIFSANGGHEVIDETAEPVYIPTQLAKVIGVDFDSMHNDLGLAGFVPDFDAA